MDWAFHFIPNVFGRGVSIELHPLQAWSFNGAGMELIQLLSAGTGLKGRRKLSYQA